MRTIAAALLFSAASAFASDAVSRAAANDPAAVAQLRTMGQPGVDALMRWRESHPLGADAQKRFEAAIDQVCRQRDCAWSGLYWYTDFAAAQDAARRQHKPILTLRLLGNLDEELSCANSRFFRTLLYSNREIGAYLRANFVLHWKSVRPVPKVTVDMGDGRTMVRTLTGNSIHYLLAADGTVLDALPGLYAPQAYLAALKEMKRLHDGYASWRDPKASLAAYHAARFASAIRTASPSQKTARLMQPPTAWDAAPTAGTKSAVEAPILDAAWFGAQKSVTPLTKLKNTAFNDDATLGDLDEHSLALVRAKRTDARNDTFKAAMKTLKESLVADTIRNEYELRPRIHDWFFGPGVEDVETLNRRVYDEIFLTPGSDQWLGLMPRDAYNAIDGEGIVATRQ